MITLFDDGRCRLKVEFYRGFPYLHLKVFAWTKSLARFMRARWAQVRKFLAWLGYAVTRAFYRESNTMMPKFAARFGFCEVLRGREWIVMEVKNA